MAEAPPQSGNLRVNNAPLSADDASSQALSEALGSSRLFIRLLGVLLVGAFLFSCVFTVNPNEVAIVLRFGKPVGEDRAMVRTNGLHFALPYPIDEIIRIGVGESKVVRASRAWYAIDPSAEATGNTEAPVIAQLSPAADGHVITADGNILHVRASMRYRISDPIAYAFRFSSVSNIIENSLNNAIQWSSVRFKADDMIHKDVAGFRDSIRQRVTEVLDRTKLGVTIETLDVERAAPGFVKEYFDAVITAEQDRSKLINTAEGEYDRVTREAEGEAKRVVAQGEAAANQLVQSIKAEATFFQDQLANYRQNPGLFRDRLRVEAITRILTNTTDKFFLPSRSDGDRREVRININREPITPKKPELGR